LAVCKLLDICRGRHFLPDLPSSKLERDYRSYLEKCKCVGAIYNFTHFIRAECLLQKPCFHWKQSKFAVAVGLEGPHLTAA